MNAAVACRIERRLGARIRAVRPSVDVDQLLIGAQFADAFSVVVDDPALDARRAAEKAFRHSPPWFVGLMAVRNHVMARFGVKTPVPASIDDDGTIGLFPIIAETPDRLVMGFDDKHLDFRGIIDVAAGIKGRRVTLTTLVRTHNPLGRAYLATVLPFHRIVVRSMLRQVRRPARRR